MKQIAAVREKNQPSGQAPVNVSQFQSVQASDLGSAPTFNLVPGRLLQGLLVIVGVLVLAGLASNHLQFGVDVRYEHADSFIELFDLNQERNIPTWFSSLLLFTNALLLTLIAGAALQARDRWRWYWCVLALIFVYLSMDEAALFHERVSRPLREAYELTGVLHHAWVLPAMACLFVFGVVYLRFALALPWRTFTLFAFAAFLYVGGALGVEMIGGNHSSQHGERNLAYGSITAVEECLEMLGQVVFLYALVDYIGTRWKSASLRFAA